MNIETRQTMKELYEEDYVLWIDETVKQLETKNIDNLDWENLLEEIKSLGNEQRHKVDSYLLQLLIHLLLYQYWDSEKEWCQKGWRDEIDNFRLQLELLLESKTLENYSKQRLDIIYQKARRKVIRKTELPSQVFPEKCPFTFQEITDFEFLPE
ncbi:MAG: DUF29 domain-containing protein [Crocosphaera sp.]